MIDQRTREEIETTIRAGILEQGTVEILDALGRVIPRPHGRASATTASSCASPARATASTSRRSSAASVWLYPQHEALKDLIAARLAAGQDLRFGVTAERVEDAETDAPARRRGRMPTASRS